MWFIAFFFDPVPLHLKNSIYGFFDNDNDIATHNDKGLCAPLKKKKYYVHIYICIHVYIDISISIFPFSVISCVARRL